MYRWTRSRGRTASPGTGPSVDHTYGTDLGIYKTTNSTCIIKIFNMAYFSNLQIQDIF